MCEITLKIIGMDCSACTSQVGNIIKRIMHTNEVEVNFLSRTVYIKCEKDNVNLEALDKKLEKSGYSILKEKVIICYDSDISRIKDKLINEFFEVQNVEVCENKKAVITLYSAQIKGADIIEWFRNNDVSIKIEKWENCEEEIWENNQVNMLKNLIISVLLATPILWNPSPYFQFILATLIQIYPARIFYKGMAKAIKNKQPNMDVLIALSTTIIYLFSTYITFTTKNDIKLYYLCEGVLVCLVLFGRYLEIIAKGETTRSLKKFMNLIPRRARIIKNNNVVEKDIDEIKINDIVIIESGERIPMDGVIVEGEGLVDESIMTGESKLISKKTGDNCISGTLNRSGKMLIKVTHIGKDTALEQIIEIVRTAQISSSPIQKLADKIVAIFIPTVILIAIIVFFSWIFIFDNGNIERALINCCGVLIVACPCALGLAIPTSIMVGTGRASELGILFKNSTSIENLYKMNVIAFDKTGTLTYGGEEVERNTVRKNTIEVIKKLKQYKIEMYILSGDNKKITKDIANQIGISNVISENTPEDKATIIKSIKEKGKKVIMVGDGINDTPAMAVSDMAISIQNGTDIAKDTADIIILDNDISKIPLAFTISKNIMKNVYENLLWALCYNIVCIPLAAYGVINPSIASAAMSFSSIAVILHSLRLQNM